MSKKLKTINFIKLSGATGDDQFPSVRERHDYRDQSGQLFTSDVPDGEGDIKDRWNKKNKKKKKKKLKLKKKKEF